MSDIFDKKKEKRLISFLYNANFFTDLIVNDNLEFTSNVAMPHPNIDVRINSAGLDEMSNEINNIINNTVTAIMYGHPNNMPPPIQLIINQILSRAVYNNAERSQPYITNAIKGGLTSFFHKNTIRDEDFDWISIDNQRLVNFVWTSLRCALFSQTKNIITINYELNSDTYSSMLKTIKPYHAMHLEQNPSNLKDKIECIKLFFDSWGVPLPAQQNLMSSIKNKWNNIKNKTDIIEWLNKNEEIVVWSWSYILDNLLNKTKPEWVDISSSDKKEIESQTRDTIITLYDLVDREIDRNFLKIQLSTNGSQQKYREKIKINSKTLNISVSIETKEKLNKLTKIKNKSIKAVIESLINDEIERLGE